MNTQETQWTLLSERPPLSEEFPVMLGRWDCDVWIDYACFSCSQLALFSNSTHWRSIKADPPARVDLKVIVDDGAYVKWYAVDGARHDTRWAWHAGIAYAREKAKGGTP